MAGLRPPILLIALLSLCVLGGCGHPHVVGSDRTVQIGLSEYKLTPQDIRVSAGRLTIAVRNYGRLTHDLVISREGQPTSSTRPLRPGQEAQLALELTPGKYSMSSAIQSDSALGAYGTLTVTR